MKIVVREEKFLEIRVIRGKIEKVFLVKFDVMRLE